MSGIFGHHDEDLGLNGAATDLLGRPSLSRQGGLGDDGPLSSTAENGRNHDPLCLPSTSGEAPHQVSQPLNSYIGLLKLSLELAEDRNIIETQAPLDVKHPSPLPECPPVEQSRFINRVLNQSARFWDILKKMSTEVESQQPRAGNGSNSIGIRSNGVNNVNSRGHAPTRGFDSGVWLGSTRSVTSDGGSNRVDMDLFGMPVSSSSAATGASVMPQRADHVLVVNLIMTYVYLLRNCRAVFARLYQALDMTATAESQSALRLPSMQFGDFQLDNNLAVQVKVLVEMMSGMLLRIGSTLGISPIGVIFPANGNASPPAEDLDYRLPFMSDPLAVSVREIILSQERAQNGVAQPGEAPPLREILSNLRRLLERRYCV
ncbi:hypothetical protein UCRPA7_1187 [Phaeoacremonium minimum UCRPA7]|uniref:Uncharacterized protein n=1 Tax=Phaeoacremonium minimum (strain UCR-PA7) TaxID=1286976 RepID=R8BVE1_PHAM7|nr:hypothetical protein UCRPA7_1187 [Phaeoacremonium minimum UCRPA7]EOO03322.1 hypothetical protein UCRPA7_1187 [Phaeoacremonium minimum UCRPA7]